MSNLVLVLNAVAGCFLFLLLAVLGGLLVCYTIAATMAQISKQQDDVEQLALKFSHKR